METHVGLTLTSTDLLLVAVLAISLGSLIKGITGMGLPLFAVPALASLTTVEEAVVLLVFPSLGANLWLIISHRQYRQLIKEHVPFVVMGFAGAFVGTWLLQSLADRWLKLILVIWLGLYLIQYFRDRDALRVFGANRKMAYPLGAAAGIVQGASGLSGQVVGPYFHARGLSRHPYAFAVAFTFFVLSIAQFTAMKNLDLLTAERTQMSLLALVPTLVFTQIGIAMSSKVSHAVFTKVLITTFILMEIKLIYDII